MDAEVNAWLSSRAEEIITFTGELVRIPSPPGNEGQLSQATLQRLDVPSEIDDIGNVLAGVAVSVEIRTRQVTTWTGRTIESDGCILPFSTDPSDELVTAAASSIEEVTGTAPEVRP